MLKINAVKPMALVRNSSGTVSVTIAERAGCWIACIMPATTAVTYTCHGSTCLLNISSARTANDMPCIVSETSSNVLRE